METTSSNTHTALSKPSRAWKSFVLAGLPLLVVLLFSHAAIAQQPSVSDEDRETVRQLLRRVAELESQVKELSARLPDSGSTATATVAAPPVVMTPAAEGVDKEDNFRSAQTKAPESPTESTSLQIRGFADAGFHASDRSGDTSAFALGQLDLFITSQLSDKFRVLSEVVFESGDDNVIGVDVERLLLQYSASDYFNFGVGRYHTAIGYYNTAYHHGTWFQTATGRPSIFAFEDEGGGYYQSIMLESQSMGVSPQVLWVGLHYVAEVSNGRAASLPGTEPVQNIVDENNAKRSTSLYSRDLIGCRACKPAFRFIAIGSPRSVCRGWVKRSWLSMRSISIPTTNC